MCVIKLEDMYGSISVTIFPRLYEQTATLWAEDTIVIINGEVQVRNDEPTILCDSAELFSVSEEELNRKEYVVHLTVHVSGSDKRAVSDDTIKVQDVYNCIRNVPGRDHFDLRIVNGEWQALLKPKDDTMQYSQALHQKLEEILGQGAVDIQMVAQ